MSFLTKLKPRKKANLPSQPVGEVTFKDVSPEVVPPQVRGLPHSPPTDQTLQVSSIFTGLQFSANVSHDEDLNSSSDTQAKVDDEEEASSFDFLGRHKEEHENPKEEKSSFEFIQNKDVSHEFSFLEQPLPLASGLNQSEHSSGFSEHLVDGNEVKDSPSPLRDQESLSTDVISSHDKAICTPSMSCDVSNSSKGDTSSMEDVESNIHLVEKVPKQVCSPGKQHPPTSGLKKRKRKAIQPGHDVTKEDSDVVQRSRDEMIKDVDDDKNRSTHDSSCPEHNNIASNTSSIHLDDTATLTTSPIHQTITIMPSDLTPSSLHNRTVCEEEESSSVKEKVDEGSAESASDNIPEAKGLAPAEMSNLEPCDKDYTIQFSHEETLAGLLQSYASGIAKYRNDLSRNEENHKNCVLEQIRLAQKQVDKWLEDCSLREREAKALAEEDYELAEQLNRQLAAARVQPEQKILSTTLEEIHSWILKCMEGKDNEVLFQKEMESQLIVLKEKHSSALEELKKEHTSLLAKEKMQLQTLENEVEREVGHIELDRSHLEKREQMLEEEASRRAISFISEKERLSQQFETVESEIKDLEVKLVVLKEKKKEIIACIVNEEQKIRGVEEELSEEREQLQSERTALHERQSKLFSQQKAFEEKRICVETVEKKHKEERYSLEDLVGQAGTIWNDVQSALSSQDQTSLQIQELLDILEDGQKLLSPSEVLMKIKTAVEVKEREVENHTRKILTGQTELGEKRKNVRDLQAQVLQLQDSKKAAVTGRQFKEAAHLANEIKSMCGLVQEEQESLAEAEKSMALSSDKLAELDDELCRIREKFSDLQKIEDKSHIEDLIKEIDILSSKSYGDYHLTHVIDTWIQLYSTLADSLCAKHGWNKTTMKVSVSSEERTPGVGMEGHSHCDSEQSSKWKERMAEIEAEIERACQEEDYNKAAKLEEELQSMQTHEHSH